MARQLKIGVISGLTGRWLVSKVSRFMEQVTFFYICIKMMVRYRTYGRHILNRVILQQIYFTGVQSLELIALIATILGTLLVVRGIPQLEQLGSLDQLSVLLVIVLIREIGPNFTAIIVVLRSGSAIAMEIGYMNTLGEIEGLEMQGIPAMHFLCTPRLIGVTISVLCLIILFDFIAVAVGFLAFSVIKGITPWSFYYNLAASMEVEDFLLVAVKGLCFGLTIPVVCLYNGFMAEGSITNVPPMVSRALVDCLINIVFLSIIISAAFLVVQR